MHIGQYISVDPAICHGKPCSKGTRIMVAIIVEMLESGASAHEIRKAYPRLKLHHIQAARRFQTRSPRLSAIAGRSADNHVADILSVLGQTLRHRYGARLRGLTLYGSHARGQAVVGSDIDVALILDDFASAGAEVGLCTPLVARLSLQHDCVISLFPIRERDWLQRRTPLLINIRREGVTLAC